MAIPGLNRLQREFGRRGLTIVGVTDDAGDDSDKVTKYIDTHGVQYPMARGGGKGFSPRGIPAAWLVGPNGKILWQGNPIRGIPAIRKPASFAVVESLVQVYQEDRATGRAPENCRYVNSTQLTKNLAISDSTLRRRVLRFRSAVADSFQERLGLTLAGDAVIQSAPWQGYRLNPDVRVVAPDQLSRA